MPVTKESCWVQVSVSFQLRPSLFSVTFTLIVISALDPAGCSMVGRAYRVLACVFSIAFRFVSVFEPRVVSGAWFCVRPGLFFGFAVGLLAKGRVRMVQRRNFCCVQTLWNVKVHQR